jgi:hypothetical protein
MSTLKCAIVIDQALPLGVIANAAAVLSLSLGKQFPELIGNDLKDSQGDVHLGITTIPITILKGSAGLLKEMREALKPRETELTVVDLTSATRTTRSYEEYARQLRNTPPEQLEYLGVALCGPQKTVNSFTGSLGLLR